MSPTTHQMNKMKVLDPLPLPFSTPHTYIECYCLDVSSATKKGKGVKKPRRRTAGNKGDENDEAGEETDEGDMEGQEVDYMSRSSSESEEEFQVALCVFV